MTTLQRSTRALLALGALTLVACSEQATNPDPAQLAGEPLAAKGGKPGGGGGGTADPAIVYVTDAWELWVMNADGSHQTRLATPGEFGAGVLFHDPAWSPLVGGSATNPSYTVAFTGPPGGIWTMELTVTAEGSVVASQFAPLNTGMVVGSTPAYSPDGTAIAFVGKSQGPCAPGDPLAYPGSLYIVPAGGGAPVPVYCSSAIHGFGILTPTWSPDGMAIAFAEHVDADGDGVYEAYEKEIRICNLVTAGDGSIACDITIAVSQWEGEGMGGPDWSNDGSTLLFERENYGGAHRNTTVCSVPLESNGGWNRVPGSPLDCLVRGIEPSWAPDDSKFVTGGIFTFNYPTLTKSKLTTGTMPDWRGPAPTGP